ncbi:hypothetical protein MOV66_08715 [Agrobacterium sp. SHOUNA12C]|uniref:hypothetical protein n=1 Tax=Rhizobium rhizogenes TaxID=359 RepID=UPI001571B711|nr:hypothetical protein [Rhizobium rhizogenes]MCJ9722702.1 hypothetical protein [Agrobacterium sp. BETTINA12B]MCJ9756722.1 hypothetical protein [Agrobacterium sp. SHOUNA12C]NTF85098.1 hypothetical protein [Rhizobium rhizogenes]NTF90739.1 hypothetical protein [Rhizobium rhizogenes]NTG51206.1 hypothetical protein [Rhizobium rhizogenes]
MAVQQKTTANGPQQPQIRGKNGDETGDSGARYLWKSLVLKGFKYAEIIRETIFNAMMRRRRFFRNR